MKIKSLFITKVVKSDFRINFRKEKMVMMDQYKQHYLQKGIFIGIQRLGVLNLNCCELGIMNKLLSSSFSLHFTKETVVI